MTRPGKIILIGFLAAFGIWEAWAILCVARSNIQYAPLPAIYSPFLAIFAVTLIVASDAGLKAARQVFGSRFANRNANPS